MDSHASVLLAVSYAIKSFLSDFIKGSEVDGQELVSDSVQVGYREEEKELGRIAVDESKQVFHLNGSNQIDVALSVLLVGVSPLVLI